MTDKNSIINAAQKFASQGRIDEAIAEWSKLLAVTEDGNIYNTIGDLYLKQRIQRDAVESFTKAASIFREDGFYPKAMALYKKILNLEKDNVVALTALAELNAKRGFTSQAVVDLKKVAELHTQQGAPEKALEVCEKILKFAPFDVGIKIRAAEISLQMGLSQRAAQVYAVIASDYSEKGEFDKAKEFFQKANKIDVNNTGALIGLSKLADRGGNQELALDYLTLAMSADPEDKDVLLRYARLSMKTGNIDQARDTLMRLIEQAPDDLDARKLLGTLHADEGHLEEAWVALQPCIDKAINVQSWPDALALLRNFEEINSIPVKERFISLYRGKGDNDSLFEELKSIAELYETKGDHDDALELLREAHEINRENSEVNDRVQRLGEIVRSASSGQDMPLSEENAELMPVEQEKTGPPSGEDDRISSEYIKVKKTEAEHYVEQGLNDEAIKIYEDLHLCLPDNKEIINAMQNLRPLPAIEQEQEPPGREHLSDQIKINDAMNEILQEMDGEGSIPGEKVTTKSDVIQPKPSFKPKQKKSRISYI